ncbi:MAG: hypothetical protein A3F12_01080 [Gammaproteobacteria bacterium RIFCSPHIGHO2_12_FULL_38_14]|nr:MAG: hypothetical protein A3F12_01080 [Gammaproteobacteria bacterium RIFCSPHIGHO2_12_FULL_38_14]
MQNFNKMLLVFMTFFLLTVTQTSFAAVPLNTTIAPMLQNVLPSIVNIKAQIKVTDVNTLQELQKERENNNKENNNPNDDTDQSLPDIFSSVASGVIIDAKRGYILTNAHVVNDAQSVVVTLHDGRHFTAKIIGIDKPSDIALLQIKADNLIAAPIGDSSKLKVGDFVAAIGNPFGLNQTVTSGIISALERTTLGIENYENFIQTDAPINPGNSGGALINMEGQLIGINTAILAPARGSIGIGFAIPINMAKSVMVQLIEYGNVKRGMLGIGAQDITPELANAFHLGHQKGAAVTQVLPDSPAETAGIQIGDIIIEVNGQEIKNASDVINTIGFLRVDTKTSIKLLRQNKPLTATVTLFDPKKRNQMVAQLDPYLYGVGLKDFTLLSPIHGPIEGVLVVSVEQDSNAWHSDLRMGDIITSVNEEKIKNINELKEAIAKADKTALLNVIRGPSAIFLVVHKETM